MTGFAQKRMGARCKGGEREGRGFGKAHESPASEFALEQILVRFSGKNLHAGCILESPIAPDMVEMKVRVQDVSQFKSLVLYKGKHARGIASRIDDQGLVGIVVHQVTIGFQGTKLKNLYVKHTTSQGLEDEKGYTGSTAIIAIATTIRMHTRYPTSRKEAVMR